MAKLSTEKRNQLILVIVAAVAIIAGLWYGVIKSRQQGLEQSKSNLANAKAKLEKAQVRVRQADQVTAAMEVATRRLGEIEETFATPSDLLAWSYLLLEKARGGHKVNVIEVNRPTTGDVQMLPDFPYDAAIFNVRGAAYFHDFGKFLADFENQFPYFHVRNIILAPGSDNPAGAEASTARMGEEQLSFKMDVVALIKPNH